MTSVTLRLGRDLRVAHVLAWCIGGIGALFLLVACRAFVTAPGYGFDLDCYVGGARRLVAGAELYLPRLVSAPFDHGGPDVYVYPPPFAIALAPFATVPFDLLAIGWLAARAVLLAAICAMLPLPWHLRAAAFGVMSLAAATLIDLNLGNVSLVLLALLVVAWRLRSEAIGGVALAFAVALRPTAGLLLGWGVIARQWRFVVAAAIVGGALFLLTLPVVGLDGWADYLAVLRNVRVAEAPKNGAVESVALALGLAPAAALVAHGAVAALALGATLYATRRDEETGFVVGLMASQLVTPLLWEHYLVTLLIPAAFLAARGRPLALGLPLLSWLPPLLLAPLTIAAMLLPLVVAGPRGASGQQAAAPALSRT